MIASDDFNRPDGALGSNWTLVQSTITIVNGRAISGSTTGSAAFWNANSFNPNFHKSQVVSNTGINYWAPGVCLKPGANYYAYYNDGTVQRVLGGSHQTILNAPSYTTGDVVALVRSDTFIHAIKNGAIVGSVEDTQIVGGAPGIVLYANPGTAALDNWFGDDEVPLTDMWLTHIMGEAGSQDTGTSQLTHINAEVMESGDDSPLEMWLTHIHAESMESGDDTPNAMWLSHLMAEVMFENRVSDIGGIYYVNQSKNPRFDRYYHGQDKKIPNPTVRTALLGD